MLATTRYTFLNLLNKLNMPLLREFLIYWLTTAIDLSPLRGLFNGRFFVLGPQSSVVCPH